MLEARATPSRRRREGVIEGRRTEDALFTTPEKRDSEPSETDADATTPAKAGGAETRDGVAATWARANRFAAHADRTDAALTAESVRRSRARVKDELGDLLFDVLMLACVCERRFGAGDGDGRRRRQVSRWRAAARAQK